MFDDKKFESDVLRTESEQLHTDKVETGLLIEAMQDFIDAGEKLDNLKKSLFYGKHHDGTVYKIIRNKKELTDINQRLLHGIIGTATESVELVQAVVKVLLDGESLDDVNIKEEVGDLLYYVSLILKDQNSDYQTEANRVIKKLKDRYPEKFSSEKAINRDLNKERETLENYNNE